jgi:ABC-type molybdate transport system substrate-binding protein
MGSVAATREKLGDLDEFYYSSIADGASIVCANGGKTAWLGTPRTFEASVEVNF